MCKSLGAWKNFSSKYLAIEMLGVLIQWCGISPGGPGPGEEGGGESWNVSLDWGYVIIGSADEGHMRCSRGPGAIPGRLLPPAREWSG